MISDRVQSDYLTFSLLLPPAAEEQAAEGILVMLNYKSKNIQIKPFANYMLTQFSHFVQKIMR